VRRWGESAETASGTPPPDTGPAAVDSASPPTPAAQSPPGEMPPSDDGSLLDQLLANTQQAGPSPSESPGATDWSRFVREIVEPYIVPGADPQQGELVACVDAAIGKSMSALLHHPDFQSLEAAWRGLHFLVRRVETETTLTIHLIDVSRHELQADLMAGEDLSAGGVYRLLVEQTVGAPGGQPWAVVVGNYTFDQTAEDAQLLGRMAKIARAAGAPFLAAASPRVLGCESLADTPDPGQWQRPAEPNGAEAWETLRRLPEACYLGLALPRLLLRLPYGNKTDPTERFDFQEMPAGPRHADYLWGNPALACACLLAQGFGQDGWRLQPNALREIDGLPLHVYRQDDELLVMPCAEAWLTERAANAILKAGLMPMMSIRGRDAVRLARFQSLADPIRDLAGRWYLTR